MELRLLIPEETSGKRSVVLNDRKWTLSDPYPLNSTSTILPFSCISYRWGTTREPHPFIDSLTMSTHTLPALSSAIHARLSSAFWTDVLCVPQASPQRQATLESMGYIYSLAAEVIIVLAPPTYSAIEEIIKHGSVSHEGLLVLEADDWLSSVWTYQEIVNSKRFYLVSEGATDASDTIDGEVFFSVLGASLMRWMKQTDLTEFALHKAFPNLSAFQDLMADWELAGYVERSALLVMSSLERKGNNEPANYFYATLGALTQEPSWSAGSGNLSEEFMKTCEAKGDFSFIYSIAEREEDVDRRWRPKAWVPTEDQIIGSESIAPIPDILRPVIAWHCWGDAQRACYRDGRLWLEGMIDLTPAEEIGQLAREIITSWMGRRDLRDAEDAIILNTLCDILKTIEFRGSTTPIVFEEGFVFPSRALDEVSAERVIVTTQIKWALGAPGFLQTSDTVGTRYIPCMLVGSVKDDNARAIMV